MNIPLERLGYAERCERIYASSVGGLDQLVLLAINHYLGQNTCCWPSMATLARRVGVTQRSVRRIVARLRDAGVISTKARPGTSSVYRIHWIALQPAQTPDTQTPDTVSYPPGHSVLPPRTLCPTPPDTVSPKPVIEPVSEPIIEPDPPIPPQGDLLSGLRTDPPEADPPPEPAPAPKPKRRASLTLDEILTIPIPAELTRLEGFSDAWSDWVRLRQKGRGKWKEARQVERMLSKLARFAGDGLDVLTGLETAYERSWQGISRDYLRPLESPGSSGDRGLGNVLPLSRPGRRTRDDAERAYQLLRRAIASTRRRDPTLPTFSDDPAEQARMDHAWRTLGYGWNALGDITDGDWKFGTKNRFISAYLGYRQMRGAS
ncbi:MAG: helix-turn-helix domain-containing protein [Myxococcota bacterium]